MKQVTSVINMFRYRLRTLLLFTAVLPPLFAIIAIVVLKIANGPRQRKVHATRQMIYQLAAETQMEVIFSRQLPKHGIQSLVKTLNDNAPAQLVQDRRRNYPGIDQGIDAWGHELIVEVDDDSIVSFRSKGPNGVDEHGCGDDVQHSINCERNIRPVPNGT